MKNSFLRLLLTISVLCTLCARMPSYAISFKGSRVPNTPLYDSRMFHFGFTLGLNMLDFSLDVDKNLGMEGDSVLAVRHSMSPGFAVGIVTDLRMGKWFNLRFIPTFSMGSRTLEYNFIQDGTRVSDKKTAESIMVFLPLEVKWKAARMTDHRPYVTAGIQYTLDMASRKTKKKQSGQEMDEYILKLNRNDFGITVGVGWDFFLPFNNKLAVELKAYFGFRDLIFREDNIYTDRINALNSRMLMLNVTFE